MARLVEFPPTPPATPSLAAVRSAEEAVCPRDGLVGTFGDANKWGDKKDEIKSSSEEEKEEKGKKEEKESDRTTDSEGSEFEDDSSNCYAVPFNSPVHGPRGQGFISRHYGGGPNLRPSPPCLPSDNLEEDLEGFDLLGENECEEAKQQDSWCAVETPNSGAAGYYAKPRFYMLSI
ncbi:uncharacterized protein LDX57_004130 [Aspergillus melleus]|uniref:uncharacterized protein n=1 Tax=Aspergillus melleus TaxID=138277 RepID=UPI001E8D2E42|nr:uncharacterized protein LDX57_004130 [Aspergillus melleus]KAH8426392.1 hypothetical protein LDX57_004130 [Aspergillus melleus]